MSAILPTISVEKPWGKDRLPAPFVVADGQRIGEIWFEPPAQLDQLLVKYIFTSEKLSIQVHPDDDQSEAAGLGRQGKSECWYVIDADPGATLGVGFAEATDVQTLRAAALDGSIEDMLVWHEVRAGDFFYIPANTVHAIGAGVSLIEVQQNSDITYRLYDYGRPRELHLDAGLAVARGEPYDMAQTSHVPADGTMRLVSGPFFVLDRVQGPVSLDMARQYDANLLAIPRSDGVFIDGSPVAVGECALVEAIGRLAIADGATCLLTRPC
ncbi:mannose-6-phosphate isomerase [Croceicoccus ponticola]|uniref:Mannose-6-phosphate isomerase n=1 Tax=Croceicoccus ponticola TaxID=2217664 RepID=A0A437H173_9SPHN|nr:class I mannose-6-phosphate isomerase [Croceicoccus ponticola]RVQ69381.1 mannose-6-phosphate isomerase [Croceicoccus ponticola]